MTHRINILSSIENHDIINWEIAFLELSRICKWSEEQRLEILTQIIDVNIQYRLRTSATSEEVLTKLLKLKYNKMSVYKYQNIPSTLEQKYFFTISAYVREIEVNVFKLAICFGWSYNINLEKIQEIFYCGLDETVKFEMTKLANRDYHSLISTLK
ncbi:hypothetical protein DMUE_1550 [Dictyocoela muelleri]|nr:hypothetical protein DMUE_1550 [Dictyocoela muelleri]